MENEQVILVDVNDQETGLAGKMEAHRKGLLHRAISIFIFNRKGHMLLQQRSMNKYHSGGLWTNACCSHPQPGETTEQAARRRLPEELGFTIPVNKVFDFYYCTTFDNGLTEHEYDHVYSGIYDGPLKVNPQEVMDTCYKPVPEIGEELGLYPGKFTAWFHLAFPRMEDWWKKEFTDSRR